MLKIDRCTVLGSRQLDRAEPIEKMTFEQEQEAEKLVKQITGYSCKKG